MKCWRFFFHKIQHLGEDGTFPIRILYLDFWYLHFVLFWPENHFWNKPTHKEMVLTFFWNKGNWIKIKQYTSTKTSSNDLDLHLSPTSYDTSHLPSTSVLVAHFTWAIGYSKIEILQLGPTFHVFLPFLEPLPLSILSLLKIRTISTAFCFILHSRS